MDTVTVNKNSLDRLNHHNLIKWKQNLVGSFMTDGVYDVVIGDEKRPPAIPDWLTEDQVKKLKDLSEQDRSAIYRCEKMERKWICYGR
ncbi:hypothetical protein FRC03_007020 [Tulasnella sp. 419]|nr:hypothetical protein FRC03_007020 [Tulasnella sp. 419]